MPGAKIPRCAVKFRLAGMRPVQLQWEADVMVFRETLRCLIVDDSPGFVDAARGLLESQGITVVGVASTSAQALRCYEELRPDVALVDIDLGTDNGFELAEQLQRVGGPTPPPVILISTHCAEDFADMIAASPAVGFLAKSTLSPNAIRDLLLDT